MNNPRLIYRVILKTLAAFAIIALSVVLLRSLFVSTEEEVKNKPITRNIDAVKLDLSGLKEGEIKKIRWDGKEIAILYRQESSKEVSEGNEKLHQSLNTETRSQQPEYFVYTNYGDSQNCPLFYSNNRFKDICTSTFFDTAGRQINNPQQGFLLEIPPHNFNDKILIIGSWE